MTTANQRPATGMDVIDNGGYFVGTVEHVGPDHFVVQKGFFFPQSHRVPNSAIESIKGQQLTLRISREQAIQKDPDYDWADHPERGEIHPEEGDVERSRTRAGITGKSV